MGLAASVAIVYAYDFKSGDLYYNWVRTAADELAAEVSYPYSGVGFGYANLPESMTIPSTVTDSDNRELKVIGIGRDAFYNSKTIKAIVIPESLEYIDWNAFGNCSALQQVTIADGRSPLCARTEGIFLSVFEGCNLQEVYVGRDIIGEDLFVGQPKLSVVSFGDVSQVGGFNSCSALKTVELPATIKTIQANAFGNTGLTEIMLPEGLERIEGGAFINTPLQNIQFPSSLTFIGEQAFAYTLLTEITIPETLGNFANAFAYSTLSQVEVASAIKALPLNCFADCASLERVILPQGLTSLGIYAFRGCSSLAEFECPPSLTTIGNSAFSDCTALTTIIFNESLESVGTGCFDGCLNLSDIVSKAMNAPTIDAYTFSNAHYTTATLYTPEPATSYFTEDSEWNNFINRRPLADYSGISDIAETRNRQVRLYYDLKGHASTSPFKGINIVKYTDDTTSKLTCP